MILDEIQRYNLREALQILRARAIFYAGCRKRAILKTQADFVEDAISNHSKGKPDFTALNDHTTLIERSREPLIAKACALAMRDVAYSIYNHIHIPGQFLQPWQYESLADIFMRQAHKDLHLESFQQHPEPAFNALQNNYRAIIERIRYEAHLSSRGTLDVSISYSLTAAAKKYVADSNHSRDRIFAAFEMDQIFKDVMSNPENTRSIKICARAMRNAALSTVNNAGKIQEWLMTGDEILEAANSYIDSAMNSIPIHPNQPRPPQLK